VTRRRATGKQRTTTSGGRDSGDHLDQLLDDNHDGDSDDDLDGDTDQDDTDDDADQDDDADDDQDQGDRDDNQDDRAGRRRKRGRRSRDDDTDDDRDRPITVEDLEKAAQRIADRQVNALLRRLDKSKSSSRDQQDPDDRGGRRRRDDRTRDRDEGRDDDRDTTRRDEEQRAYDQREARLAFRDYFGGDGRSLSTTERELANTLARVEIGTRLDEHGDPDRAGREAADRISDQLTEFRRLVEKQTVAALRKRGALRERGSRSSDDEDTADSGNAGGSQPPGRAPAPAKLADKRQAAKAFAADYNTRLGHTPTTTDAGSKTG
jgi:hypothetical protein